MQRHLGDGVSVHHAAGDPVGSAPIISPTSRVRLRVSLTQEELDEVEESEKSKDSKDLEKLFGW